MISEPKHTQPPRVGWPMTKTPVLVSPAHNIDKISKIMFLKALNLGRQISF